MMHRTAGVLVWMLLSSVAFVGQTSFQGLTAGASTRADVERVFGRPVRTLKATLVEYSPPVGIAKLEAEYGAGSQLVQRLEVYFARPITRAALVKKLNLPQQADAIKKNASENLVEYFGGSASLALTYASGDASSGVNQVGYYSPELFARASGIPVAAGSHGLQMEDEVSLDGTTLTYYPRNSVEECRSDCTSNASCRGFTWIKAGTYNPRDASMCYLLSAVTRRNRARGHISGVKK